MRAKENPGMRAGGKIAPHCNGRFDLSVRQSRNHFKPWVMWRGVL